MTKNQELKEVMANQFTKIIEEMLEMQNNEGQREENFYKKLSELKLDGVHLTGLVDKDVEELRRKYYTTNYESREFETYAAIEGIITEYKAQQDNVENMLEDSKRDIQKYIDNLKKQIDENRRKIEGLQEQKDKIRNEKGLTKEEKELLTKGEIDGLDFDVKLLENSNENLQSKVDIMEEFLAKFGSLEALRKLIDGKNEKEQAREDRILKAQYQKYAGIKTEENMRKIRKEKYGYFDEYLEKQENEQLAEVPTTPTPTEPTKPTPAPTEPTKPAPAPTKPAPAPTEPTKPTPAPPAPTKPAPAPTKPTPAPTEPTKPAPAPTKPAPAPTKPTPAPTEPTKPTPAPTKPTPAPAETTKPVEKIDITLSAEGVELVVDGKKPKEKTSYGYSEKVYQKRKEQLEKASESFKKAYKEAKENGHGYVIDEIVLAVAEKRLTEKEGEEYLNKYTELLKRDPSKKHERDSKLTVNYDIKGIKKANDFVGNKKLEIKFLKERAKEAKDLNIGEVTAAPLTELWWNISDGIKPLTKKIKGLWGNLKTKTLGKKESAPALSAAEETTKTSTVAIKTSTEAAKTTEEAAKTTEEAAKTSEEAAKTSAEEVKTNTEATQKPSTETRVAGVTKVDVDVRKAVENASVFKPAGELDKTKTEQTTDSKEPDELFEKYFQKPGAGDLENSENGAR